MNYTKGDILDRFDKLPAKKRAEILWVALDYMQGYNGRSRGECVALAMGFDSDDGRVWNKVKV